MRRRPYKTALTAGSHESFNMRSLVVTWWAAVFAVAGAYPSTLYEGSSCKLPTGGGGVCTVLSRCPEVVHTIRAGSSPGHCSWQQFEEVICCPSISARQTRKTATEAPRRSHELIVRKSAKACQDYREKENEVDREPRYHILGGIRAELGEFPHMVSLGYKPAGSNEIVWNCGGTLISDRYVLTAAHCATDRNFRLPVKARLGSLRQDDPAAMEFSVEEVTMHPEFNRRRFYHDLALVRLSEPVPMGEDGVTPACLYQHVTLPRGPLTVTGWGATAASGLRRSNHLLKANLSVVADSECDRFYPRHKMPRGFHRGMICAGDPNGVADTCGGDSGGPVHVKMDDEYYVAGVTSVGPSPCGGVVPSIYTRVSNYLDWIESVVWP